MGRWSLDALFWPILLLFVLLCSVPVLGIDGTFQGQVVAPPANQLPIPGWIYVQGRNRLLRRVEVAHAEIILKVNASADGRRRCTLDCLNAGQEIRVTAEQDGSGEWRAKRVEILKLTVTGI
jgi:hypothetical protein